MMPPFDKDQIEEMPMYPSGLFINLLGVSVGAMLKDKFCVKSKGRELIGPLRSAIIVAFSVA